MAVSLLVGLICLLIGFFARDIWDKVTKTYEYFKDRIETPAGVVRPERTPITKNQPVDLSTDTGPIPRPSPDAIAYERFKEDHKIR